MFLLAEITNIVLSCSNVFFSFCFLGISCHCTYNHCGQHNSSCNVTAPDILDPHKFCLVKKVIRHDGSKSLEQFCLQPGLTLTYFYCLRSRTCTENGDEACYCCTEDYCNTEGFYNKKFGITNAPIDPSSTKSTSTSERPSESASLLCLCSCMCACCLLDLEYMTCASHERIWAVTKILADTCRGHYIKLKSM